MVAGGSHQAAGNFLLLLLLLNFLRCRLRVLLWR